VEVKEKIRLEWSTDSEATRKFCEENDFIFALKFVETAPWKNLTFVSFTVGKQHEVNALKRACDEKAKDGYVWFHKSAKLSLDYWYLALWCAENDLSYRGVPEQHRNDCIAEGRKIAATLGLL
jgi:hypothetical protein